MKIREAQPQDDAAIGELLVDAFVAQYAKKMPEVVVTDRRKAELRDVAAKRAVAKVWVAEVDAEIVGTVALWGVGAQGSEAWLSNACDLRHLAVSEKGRGKGVARALLDAAERHARMLGAAHVCLHVRRGATGVAALYTGRGYRREPAGDLDLRPEVFLEAFLLTF